MVTYRPYRNTDPPGFAAVWNDVLVNRGAVLLRPLLLETHVFAKPYFDPEGLIFACDGAEQVGFIHAGFSPTDDQATLSPDLGVICLLAVKQSHQHQGIGTELIERAEQYLKSYGVTSVVAGPLRPHNPFYTGLYGGSDAPGCLQSDSGAAPFLEYSGYEASSTHLVFQRRLDQPPTGADARFGAHRKHFELIMEPEAKLSNWWQECTLGALSPVEFRLEEKQSKRVAARALAWEMDAYKGRWQHTSAGILELEVIPELRRQGVGKFFLAQVLKFLQERYFGLVEMQLPEVNHPGIDLLKSIGFEKVDAGRFYKKMRG